jgi:hypothetical protein
MESAIEAAMVLRVQRKEQVAPLIPAAPCSWLLTPGSYFLQM